MRKNRLLFIGCLLALAGCQTKYTQFRVTNLRGEVIADWVAAGKYSKDREGYQIHAVQRISGEPYPQTTCYPEGWSTLVVGPNIARWPVAKPEWLERYEAPTSPVGPLGQKGRPESPFFQSQFESAKK